MSGRLRLLVVAAVVALGVLNALPTALPAVADPDGGQGVGLEAVVGESGPGAGSGSGSGSGAGSGTDVSAPDETGTDPDAAVAEPVTADASTVLDVSGLRTRSRASIDPAGGRLLVRFVVRNSSHRTVDATATFWATNAVGHRVGTTATARVDQLAPGEARTVSQEVTGVGQWTIVTAHTKLAPVVPPGAPTIVPVVRDRTVLVVPWAVIVLLVLVAVSIVSARLSGERAPTIAAQPVVTA